MNDPSVSLLLVLAATFLMAGLVKGITGMGLPTVAMGVLGALISPLAAAGLLLVPSFVTNVWQLLTGGNLSAIVARLWTMMLAVAAGTLASAGIISGTGTGAATAALGATLILYAGYTLLARQITIPPRHEPWLSPLVGFVTGLVTGATGVFVIPAVPYLQALGLERDDLVQALGLSFTVSTVALALGIGMHGGLEFADIGLSALAVLPALAGMALGQRLRKRISPTAFRRGFLICLLLLGCEMLLRSIRV
ncbi:sulfite exporter TauE/SafE family protein [Aureimonas altamirensis]|uniref:sulfite exporter TauE/SafE family protein n=1 Tax=Aureimonas altamirensis TaxID=370622 RepID=UPI002036727D|nr:sulfite exporter TauE/SafE family protein [Aureimonas altamirensis]MCM2504366.1 sulfite exporter TauE/SafE family protein [Aureimonas altamirensis]